MLCKNRKILVTGSQGLVGSEACLYFGHASKNNKIYGIDNDARKHFFDVSTKKNLEFLSKLPDYTHYDHTVIDKDFIFNLFKEHKFDVVLSCHGQPSHDWAAKDVFLDFNTNCTSVLYLLEATRLYSPKDSVFIQCSTDKVYGTNTDLIKLKELETRYEYDDERFIDGIPETMSIDQTTHSLFGCGKVASDVYAQEYARYYGMNIGITRSCCISGGKHFGSALHGYLSYIVKCAMTDTPYTIFGYKGKQVRSNIHALDLVRAFEYMIENPKSNMLFNVGGGKTQTVSILETIDLIYKLTGKKLNYSYEDKARIGDHCVFFEDLKKITTTYPQWSLTRSVEDIINEIASSFK